jgi:hypothetical protein
MTERTEAAQAPRSAARPPVVRKGPAAVQREQDEQKAAALRGAIALFAVLSAAPRRAP